MTTFEHAMVGVNGALAAGLNRRWGWKAAAMAGLVAVSPDWDGLTLLGGPALFDQAHRVWGHNLFVAVAVGLLLGVADYRYDLVGRIGRALGRIVTIPDAERALGIRTEYSTAGYLTWGLVAVLAALSHLAADLVVSGTATMTDWKLKLFWPVSDASWIFPRIRWGDPGVSLLFVAGGFALYRWKKMRQWTACGTLAAVLLYVYARPLVNL